MTAPNTLTFTVGETTDGIPAAITLNSDKPHARWAGNFGTGKSVQLRHAIDQLLRQIPAAPERLRLVLFTHEVAAAAAAIPRLKDVYADLGDAEEGVLVVPPQDPTEALRRLNEELAWRRTAPTVPPLVIVADEYPRWRKDCELFRHLVDELDTDPEVPVVNPGTGIHLLLASWRLVDFADNPAATEGRFELAGRIRGRSFFDENADTPRSSNKYSTVVMDLAHEEQEHYRPFFGDLARLCGSLSNEREAVSEINCRAAYLMKPDAVQRFTLASYGA